MDDDGIPYGLTREMKEQARDSAAPARADQDSSWRRGAAAQPAPDRGAPMRGADQRPAPGAGGGSIREMMAASRGGGGAAPAAVPMRGDMRDVRTSGAAVPMRGDMRDVRTSGAAMPMRGDMRDVRTEMRGGADAAPPAPLRADPRGSDPRSGAAAMDPRRQAPVGLGAGGAAPTMGAGRAAAFGAPAAPAGGAAAMDPRRAMAAAPAGGAAAMDPRRTMAAPVAGGAASMDPRRAMAAPAAKPADSAAGYKTRGLVGGGADGFKDARLSAPPAAPAKEAPKEDEEITAKQFDEATPLRTIDVYWQSYPQEVVWIRKSRRETVREIKSRMPVVLRNLAPDTTFDPRDMWHVEKERVEGEKAKLVESAEGGKKAAADSKKSGASKKAAVKKPTKKEEMIEKNKKDSEDKESRADLEKLDNAAKSSRNKARLGADLMATKCATPHGKLRQLLMILDAELVQQATPAVLDVLWAIEQTKLYHEALEQEEEEEDKDSKKAAKKDDKKEKDKKTARSGEAALCHEFRKELRAAKKLRKELGPALAAFQLEKMYDRLPPLSPFLKSWRLDDWQKKVLHHVDTRRSAIVCAPTSSGKTVISTYTCVNYKRVLFCVPTEPLVWQVAAMFEKLLQGSAKVALATNQLAYRPSEDVSRVVVGTPLALESALVKIRGFVGDEVTKRWDYAQLEGGFDFEYAVFDEVHALDGEEGAALQRLVRSVSCPTLALSATIGNAAELRDWWQAVRDDACPGDEVVLVEHTGRFINVQNLVLDAAQTLSRLHPAAALTASRLLGEGTEKVAFALTPADASTLYASLAKEYGDKVKDLDPSKFFAKLADAEAKDLASKIAARNARLGIKDVVPVPAKVAEAQASVRARISLDNAKEYETELKARLSLLAREDAARLDSKILEPFVPQHLRGAGASVEAAEDAAERGEFVSADDAGAPAFSMLTVAFQMREKALFPSLAFHLDSFRCLALFKSLLAQLEAAQEAKYPTWSDELAAKAAAAEKDAEARTKAKDRNAKEAEEEAKEGVVDEGAAYVDVTAPHPEFVLAPPTSRLSAKEIDDILDELKRDTQGREALPASHILVRALRRGFGIYIDDAAFAVYRRVVQRLAQQGKLAIVFSDVSLAYGVNMPFRTVVFCGDEGRLLTPLLAQQMAGRAGRRGLDTQGNLVYLGMSWPRIRRLMVGTVPAIVGKPPHFATVAMPLVLSSEFWKGTQLPPLCKSVDRDILQRLLGASLAEFRSGTKRSAEAAKGRVDAALATLKQLGLCPADGSSAVDTLTKKPVDMRPMLCAVWELRDYLPESLALAFALPHLLDDFVKNRYNFKRAEEDAASEAVQIDFFAVLLHIVDRTPCPAGSVPMSRSGWLLKAPERVQKWKRWEGLLEQSQARLEGLPVYDAGEIDDMRLAVPPGADLDPAVFDCCKDRRLPVTGSISSLARYKLKNRIWHVGNILMKAHNCLQLPGEFITLSPLLRKCCQRIKYMLSDDINVETDVTNSTFRVDEEDEALTVPTVVEGEGDAPPADAPAAP
ncbi:hypothetical protein M885DRAFT_510993 [Pelagophyceae sp. CCMP2097]|nr:hypothetical protein M885DRAFT_510993 [Pelagophyceae sp. CCMP2097]